MDNNDKLQNKQFKADYKTLKNSVTVINKKLLPHQYFEKNPNLKKAGVKFNYTPLEMLEIKKCFDDPIYFINRYCYIVNLNTGLTLFNTYDYQDTLINIMNEHNRVIVKFPRQSGKTTTTAAYVVWQLIFQPYSAVAILANKEKTAIGILQKVRILYENLPAWIQSGVKEWSKKSIKLENGSCAEASATSSSAIRSMSIKTLIIDEAAFIDRNIWGEFYASVYPTVSSSKSAKIFLISTPNGMNHFYKIWNEANIPDDAVDKEGNKLKKSDFIPFQIAWNDVPDRDEKFKRKVIGEFGIDYWNQEFNCEFLGSAGTLISGKKLKELAFKVPIQLKLDDNLRIYELPVVKNDEYNEEGKYIAIFDTGEGVGADYSTIHVFRVDIKPYVQVATYANNKISIRDFPIIVESVGKLYNNAVVIGENNTIGAAILDDLFYDLEYENLFYGSENNRNDDDDINPDKFGIRMSTRSKSLGCSNLKTNIEDDKFILNDEKTIEELTWFVKKGATWKADGGKHDDLVTPMVIFSYFLRNREWIELWVEQEKERSDKMVSDMIEEDLAPLGFMSNGIETIDLESGDYFF